MKTIIYGALVALTVTTANAAETDNLLVSGNAMLPYCKEASGSQQQASHMSGVCTGIVMGVAFSLQINQMHSVLSPCAAIPPDATPSQLVRVVVSYMEATPEETHYAFVALASVALINAYSCKK